uniref:Uncharacterized protein n=1 Tax=Arundo donax TaxID=35708 RepID=A0A0A9RVV7_ARUDO
MPLDTAKEPWIRHVPRQFTTNPPRFSILSFSSSRDALWSEVSASAFPARLSTARQSPALDTTIPPFRSTAVTQHAPPLSSLLRNSSSVLR